MIIEREDEIEELNENERTLRMHYENLIRESMQSAKNKVIESLPNLIKTSKQKVHVVANWFSLIFVIFLLKVNEWIKKRKEISMNFIILVNYQIIKP